MFTPLFITFLLLVVFCMYSDMIVALLICSNLVVKFIFLYVLSVHFESSSCVILAYDLFRFSDHTLMLSICFYGACIDMQMCQVLCFMLSRW